MRQRTLGAMLWILSAVLAVPVARADEPWSEEKPIPLTDPPAYSVQAAPFDPIVVDEPHSRSPAATPPRRAGGNRSFPDVNPLELLDEAAAAVERDSIPVRPLSRNSAPPGATAVSVTTNAHGANPADKSQVVSAVPTILVETSTPAEVIVDKAATFTITVKNLGQAAADQVLVRATVPEHAELQKTQPKPQADENGELQFQLGTLAPNASRQIELQLLPRQLGEIDLKTVASFSVATRTAWKVRKPNLTMTCRPPATAMFGEIVTFELELTNTGDGTAADVLVMPKLDQHAMIRGKSDRPIQVGSLGPGQSRTIPVAVRAVAAGDLQAEFKASEASGGEVSATGRLRVQRAVIEASLHGPNLNYLHRDGVYEIHLANPGDAAAKNIEVVCTLPAGLKLKVLERRVEFDSRKNTLTWLVPSLGGGQSESLCFKAQSIAAGEQPTNLVARADGELAVDAQHVTTVISRSDLQVTLVHRDGPLDVNAAARFEIAVENAGTKLAEDVRLRVVLSDALNAVASDEYSAENNELTFPDLTLAAEEQRTLVFQAVGREAGDHVVRVILESGSSARPLAIERSVFFYDRQETARVGSRPDGGKTLEPNPLK